MARINPTIELAILSALLENKADTVVSPALLNQKEFRVVKLQWTGFLAHAKAAPRFLKRDGELLTIWLKLTQKPEINAFVTKLKTNEKNQYLLTYYLGTFSAIFTLFTKILLNPSIPVNTQNQQITNNRSVTLLVHKRTLFELIRSEETNKGSVFDQKYNDAKYSHDGYNLLLVSIALEFLYFHELTHIEHGHLEFIRKNKYRLQALFQNEYRTQKRAAQVDMNRKAIEFEADIGAAEWLFDAYWFNEDVPYRGTLMRNFKRYIKGNADMFEAISTSLIWLFHLMEDLRVNNKQFSPGNYPSPSCRILSVYQIFLIIAQTKGGNQEIIRACFLSALTTYTERCANLQLAPLVAAETFKQDSAIFQELKQIDEHRLAILATMKPYQFKRDQEI